MNLSHRRRVAILIEVLAVSLAGVLFMDPIPQDLAYHLFADSRGLVGIPNFNDVVSNAGFALVGVLGVLSVVGVKRHTTFVQPGDAGPYAIFFVAVALVSLASGYYHWAPSNERLLWDRLPMSVAFMAFASAIIADRVDARAGNTWLLPILIVLGLASLFYWDYTEQLGRGDLRFYAFVQFFPVVAISLVLCLFPEYRYVSGRYIAWVFAWYGLSKLFEHFDKQVFGLLGNTISGHTLKHLAAAASALVVLRMLSSRTSKPARREGCGRSRAALPEGDGSATTIQDVPHPPPRRVAE